MWGRRPCRPTQPRKTYFEGVADVQYFRTDNMFLAHDHKESADVLVSTVQIALAPTAYDLGGGTFAPRIGYYHQWFNYGLISSKRIQAFDFDTSSFREVALREFDFNAQTAFIDGRWTRDNWIFDAGFNYKRLLTWPGFDEFYRESFTRWGVRRMFPLDETKAFTIGYEGDYRFTDTGRPPPFFTDNYNDRQTTACSSLTVRVFARRPPFSLTTASSDTRFTQGESRNDYLHSFGLPFTAPSPNKSACVRSSPTTFWTPPAPSCRITRSSTPGWPEPDPALLAPFALAFDLSLSGAPKLQVRRDTGGWSAEE